MKGYAWLQRVWRQGRAWADAIEAEMHPREKSSPAVLASAAATGLHTWAYASHSAMLAHAFRHIATLQAQGITCAWAAHTPTAALRMHAQQQGVDTHSLFVVDVPTNTQGFVFLHKLLATPALDWLFVEELAPEIFPADAQAHLGLQLQALHQQAREHHCHLVWLHSTSLEGAPREHAWLHNELLCYADGLPC